MENNTDKTTIEFNGLTLIKGKHYNVKHEHNKQTVRRIFKGVEMRFNDMPCYVFTGRIGKNVSVDIDECDNGVCFWHWHKVKHAPNEISIPFYNIKNITHATN